MASGLKTQSQCYKMSDGRYKRECVYYASGGNVYSKSVYGVSGCPNCPATASTTNKSGFFGLRDNLRKLW